MKRHVWNFEVKHYSTVEQYKIVATTLLEAIKRVAVVYKKVHYSSSPDIISVEKGSEVYV